MWEKIRLTTTAEVATDATKERAETMIYVDIKGAVKMQMLTKKSAADLGCLALA